MISGEEWEDYNEYLAELTDEELKIELEWLETIGKAKKRGSTIVQNESYYEM
jgi:hypothetical protein